MDEYKKKRKAILFTIFYPYTHQGVSYDFYVLNELQRLCENFETVDIVSVSVDHDGRLETPANVTVHHFRPELNTLDKLSVISLFGKKFFWQELRNLKNIYGRGIQMALFKAIAVYALKSGKFYDFVKNILNKIDFRQHDVCIYCYWNFEYALAASLLKEIYPVKLVVRNHSLDLYFDRMPEKYQPFKRQVFFKSDLFLFISDQGMQYFFDVHNIPDATRGKAMLNCIGVENASTPYKKTYNKLRIISNAWVQPLKRVDLLIQSLAMLDIEVEWIHIGDGVEHSAFVAIQKTAKELLDGKDNIRYEFAGRKNIDEIFRIYQQKSINLFINLSVTEGTPVSMMEALSFGVPIIGTAVGGVPELVQDGLNGFLLPVDIDAATVAAKIKEYFLLPIEKKENLSANAYRTWNEKYNAVNNSYILIEKILAL